MQPLILKITVWSCEEEESTGRQAQNTIRRGNDKGFRELPNGKEPYLRGELRWSGKKSNSPSSLQGDG